MRPRWDLRAEWVDREGGDVSTMLCSICCSFHPRGERALPTPKVRNSFAKQSGSEGSRASQSVWGLAGEHFHHIARASGTAQPGCGCAQHALLLQGRGSAESSAPLSPWARAPSGASRGWGTGTASSAPHKLPDPPRAQRGPLNRHFHTPTKRPHPPPQEVMAQSLLVVPGEQKRGQTAERRGWKPPASPQGHLCRAGSPSGGIWMSTARPKASTDGQPRCAPQRTIKSISLQPFQQGM